MNSSTAVHLKLVAPVKLPSPQVPATEPVTELSRGPIKKWLAAIAAQMTPEELARTPQVIRWHMVGLTVTEAGVAASCYWCGDPIEFATRLAIFTAVPYIMWATLVRLMIASKPDCEMRIDYWNLPMSEAGTAALGEANALREKIVTSHNLWEAGKLSSLNVWFNIRQDAERVMRLLSDAHQSVRAENDTERALLEDRMRKIGDFVEILETNIGIGRKGQPELPAHPASSGPRVRLVVSERQEL